MSILTRLTRETARRILPSTRYLERMGSIESNGSTPVFLTFDDGPHPECTPQLLDQLAGVNAKATFFVLGSSARKHPELIRRTLSEGHSIGTHTWSHLSAAKVPVAKWINDVLRARHEIEAITGQECPLFRPPYGELTPLSLIALLRAGTRIVQWSQDTKDYTTSTHDEFCRWFINNQPSAGAVVLMHDNQKITCAAIQEGLKHWQADLDFLAIPMTAEPSTAKKKL